jgi:hypothetical protein
LEIENKRVTTIPGATLIKNNVRLDVIIVNQEQQIKQFKEDL